MDHLWTPWRYAYVTTAESAVRAGVPEALAAWPGDLGCVFCNLIASIDHAIASGMDRDQAEAAGGLILRAKQCFICLNAFPYTSGHVMVMPYAHLDRIAALPAETLHELADLAQLTERALDRALYAARIQLRHERRPRCRSGSGRASASARHAALGGRYQLYDHRGRDPRIA